MQKHAGAARVFDIDDGLNRLSDLGNQLETYRSAVDFELFRPELNATLSYTERNGMRAPTRFKSPFRD
jgi:transposase, IS5 family